MAESISDEKARAKAELWRERIAEQESSGVSVRQFCEERGLSLWSFYDWRKRLRESGLVRFALVDRRLQREQGAGNSELEVVFATGERLRIRTGVDGATLRTVVEALRR
jgi:transposase